LKVDQPIDLEWILELTAVRPQAKRAISDRYARILLAERRRKRTVLEWLHKKGLITANEFKAGRALALLIEWRAASIYPASSALVFGRKALEASPYQLPYEVPLLTRQSDDDDFGEGGTVIDVDEIRATPGNAVDLFNQTIRDRLNQYTCAGYELSRVDDLLKRALPERPDLTIILGHAVTERIRVRDIPHHDVEILCAALHVIKELWRHDLLEDLVDEATGIRPRRARSASRHSQPNGLPLGSGREATSPRNSDRQAREASGKPVQEAA
jgi:hypothetical protein